MTTIATWWRCLFSSLCTLLLVSCGGGGGGGTGGNASAPPPASVLTASNAAVVTVDNGPAGARTVINMVYVDLTLCRPGTQVCTTIDHVLVDTGSYGLRIIDPGSMLADLALPDVSISNGNPTGECSQFFSGYMWGSVRLADVKIGGELAPSIAIHHIADPRSAFSKVPASCNSTGANLGTLESLGAKGILGIGLFNQDCGTTCTTQAVPGAYYSCSSTGCTSSTMPLNRQVANPVAAFTSNNNGVVLKLPAVPAGGVASVTGSLVFGIDTQPNNQVGAATVYATNSAGNFTTVYKGTSLTSSFLDSGSNALFFPDASIPRCASADGFYCPPSMLLLSAVNSSANGASGTVNFSVENIESRGSTVYAAAVAGGLSRGGRGRSFDWGVPFFYGRDVFVAIQGKPTQHGTGPYWAY